MGVIQATELGSTELGAPPVLSSTADAVAAVRKLLPGFAERAAETDKSGNVPRESVRELEAAGLFGILTPRAYGGSALGWEAFFSVVSEIGTACGSTAWVFGVLTGHNHMVTRFPEEVQKRVLCDQTQHMSVVFRLSAPWRATPTDGGYIITGGQGRYCSGVDHARWVGINAVVDSGPSAGQLAFCLIETERLTLLNDWDTMGMRGTQSRSIVIEELFVKDELVALATDLAGPPVGPAAEEGVFYSWPYFALAPFAIVGAPLGVARGVMSMALEGTKARIKDLDAEIVAGMAASFTRLAHCDHDIEMAHDILLKDVRMIDSTHFSKVTPLDVARFRRDLARAPQMARYATVRLFENAGGSGIYKSNPIERMMRDVNSGAAHYAFTDDISAPNYGRALLELGPAKSNNFV